MLRETLYNQFFKYIYIFCIWNCETIKKAFQIKCIRFCDTGEKNCSESLNTRKPLQIKNY